MHAVIENFHARRLLQKSPQVPRRVNRDANFHVMYITDRPGIDQMPSRQHIGRVAKLKIDSSSEFLAMTLLDDCLRLREILA